MGITELNKSGSETKLQLAASYESVGNFLHAIQIYTSLIEEDETNLEFYIRFVNLYQKMGRISEAGKLIDKLVNSVSDNDYAFLFASDFMIRHSYWNKALNIITRIDADNFPIVHYWAGLCCYRLNDHDNARTHLCRAKSFGRQNEFFNRAVLLLAQIEYDGKNYKIAQQYIDEIKNDETENWEVNLLSGKIYLELGMFAHSSKNIQIALNQNKTNPEILSIAVKSFFLNDEPVRSERAFNELMELSDNIPAETYYYYGIVLKKQNEVDKAKDFFHLALKIEPGFEPAIGELNKLKFK